eukprot:6743779-Pyramimonas_sp.AAC.3
MVVKTLISVWHFQDRFVAYCEVATTADERSISLPSSPGQWDLLHLLKADLKAAGVPDGNLELTEHGYLIARIPATPVGRT